MVDDEKMDLSREDFMAAADALSTTGNTPVDPAKIMTDSNETALLYGDRIRMAREWKGFTIAEVALKTGLTADYLARAEAGKEMLPLGTLVKVAKTLSLRLADVISRGREPFTVVRSGESRPLQRFGNPEDGFGYSYASLAPNKKGKAMEPFLVTLYPHERHAPSSHEGQEFIYVVEGEIEVILEGKRQRLGPGDAIYYDSVDDHIVTAYGDAPAKIVAVFST